jgi:23S rRNA pseudouridine1911/1915/1917 synthase
MITPRIIYEDNQILVAVKDPGVLSQAGEKDLPDILTLLKVYLKEKYAKPGNVFLGLVHRLDLNVGGVMVFAKTSKAASRLSNSIRNNEFEKTYLGVVEGEILEGTTGFYEDYLSKDLKQLKATIETSDTGKLARLSYESLAVIDYQDTKLSLVKIKLITGRFHQIRVQFASRNYPIYGDYKYGKKQPIANDSLALWAYELTFAHPVSKDRLTFTAKPENELFLSFMDIINQLIKEQRL